MLKTVEQAQNEGELSHSDWIRFQHGILESLVDGESPERVASVVREKIVEVYAESDDFELGISVNDRCNLTCEHCYYASTHDKSLEQRKGLLDVEAWERVIDESLKVPGIGRFSVLGKEPLLSPDITSRILRKLEAAKTDRSEIKYEMVNNGTLIERNIDWLSDLDFHFFSISFDGYGPDHDRVRGSGTYELSKRGLRAARDRGINNLAVTHTAMPHNTGSLDRMIDDLADSGARYFSIGFCFPTSGNNSELSANLRTFDEVIEKVENAPSGVDISINLSGEDHVELIGFIYRRGDIQLRDLAVTEDFAPTLIKPLAESPRTAIQFNVLPTMFYGGFRLDCTGAAIDYCFDLRNEESRAGFGNLRESSVAELRETSRSLWPGYTEKFYSRLQSALRGETVSSPDGWHLEGEPVSSLNVLN